MTDVVLETNGLTKYYHTTLALDHLSLRVRSGRVRPCRNSSQLPRQVVNSSGGGET
jgi:hypothetical protein